jgi:uncharacterized protein (DUF2164 family)
MAARASQGPMRIKLTEQGRERLATRIQAVFLDEFDLELSEFRTQRLIDFFIGQLGAPIYNQAIQDARSFFTSKLDDLEGEFYEPEEPS